MADNLLLFVGKNSPLIFWLKRYKSSCEKIVQSLPVNGELIFLKKHVPPKDFACYVVTHKDVKLDADALPEGYKIFIKRKMNLTQKKF